MSNRSRVVFHVDSATDIVTRNGKVVDLSPTTVVNSFDGAARTLADIQRDYAEAYDLEAVRSSMTPDVQQAVGIILFEAIGAETFLDARCRWIEIAVAPGAADGLSRFIRNLPWPLTAQPDPFCFLAQRGADSWLFTLEVAAGGGRPEVLFPPEPRILLMIPKGDVDTDGERHEKDILALLKPNYSQESYAKNVMIAQTWPEALAVLADDNAFDPHIVYFYGHGSSKTGLAELMFDQVETQLPEVSATTIGNLFESLTAPRRPALFFGNCCSGANAILAAIGDAIGPQVGCVISNRTVVDTHAAQTFGLEVLQALVGDRLAPDVFMPNVTNNLIIKVSGSHLAGRWACPVMHTNYDQWISLAPKRFSKLHRATAGRIVDRLDRKAPVAQAKAAFAELVEKPGYRLGALVWQAKGDQGVNDLGPRLRDEFLTTFTTHAIREYVVDLQAETRLASDPRIPKASMRGHIFTSLYVALGPPGETPLVRGESPGMDHVIKRLSGDLSNQGAVVLIRMVPVDVKDESSQKLVQAYWKVWIEIMRNLAAIGRPDQARRILVTFALQISTKDVDIPNLLPQAVDVSARITDFQRLESVTAEDVKNHIEAFTNIYDEIAFDEIAMEAEKIHHGTQGVFMPTVQMLKRIAGFT
ncbi:hypothetical protein [Rhizobium leguminosarum]|uniref:hypothetical protein n=1 Tax=Rhizobium leguminosarum TaxID=384 RepID=UPI001031BD2D|nr:hypothetical protein [Rhizobium leguminosarum]TBF23423.1 hypothetical protein ELG92_34275 [Rhizobium leguminosarum]